MTGVKADEIFTLFGLMGATSISHIDLGQNESPARMPSN